MALLDKIFTVSIYLTSIMKLTIILSYLTWETEAALGSLDTNLMNLIIHELSYNSKANVLGHFMSLRVSPYHLCHPYNSTAIFLLYTFWQRTERNEGTILILCSNLFEEEKTL